MHLQTTTEGFQKTSSSIVESIDSEEEIESHLFQKRSDRKGSLFSRSSLKRAESYLDKNSTTPTPQDAKKSCNVKPFANRKGKEEYALRTWFQLLLRKCLSPLAFHSSQQEYDFLRFFYGEKMIRIRVVLFVGACYWVLLTFSDFTDYKNLTQPLRILNFALRGICAVTNTFALLFSFGCVRRRIWLTESLLLTTSCIYLGFTSIKHGLKGETHNFPTILGVVAVVVLSVVRPRSFISFVVGALSYVLFVATTAILYPQYFAQSAFVYCQFAMLLALFVASSIVSLLAEHHFRCLFLTNQRLESAKNALKTENEKSVLLLENILPRHFVSDPYLRGRRFVQSYDDLVVLVHDLVSFTSYASTVSGDVLVKQLNTQFSLFESMASHLFLEKLKSAGDSLVLFAMDGERGAARCVLMAQEMIASLRKLNSEEDTDFKMRVGISMSSGYLGVLGADQLEFDLFGKAQIEASKMESTSKTNRVQVTKTVRDHTLQYFDYELRQKQEPLSTENHSPTTEPSYLLLSSHLNATTLAAQLCKKYEEALEKRGLPLSGIIDTYTSRMMLDETDRSHTFNMYHLKDSSLSSSDIGITADGDGDSQPSHLGEANGTAHHNRSISSLQNDGDWNSVTSSQKHSTENDFNSAPTKVGKNTVHPDKNPSAILTHEQYKKKYAPNRLTTLFSSWEVTLEFLSHSYKENATSMKYLFLVYAIFMALDSVCSTILFSSDIGSAPFIIKWLCTGLAIVSTLFFFFVPIYSRSPLMGSYLTLFLIFLQAIVLYTQLFQRKEHLIMFGDQLFIFLLWCIFCSLTLPWVLKTPLAFGILLPFLILFSWFGHFSLSLLATITGTVGTTCLSSHNVHYVMALNFSKQKRTEWELEHLKDEQKTNKNLMRSVVPDKLLPHLKTWISIQYNNPLRKGLHSGEKSSSVNRRAHPIASKLHGGQESDEDYILSFRQSSSQFGSLDFYRTLHSVFYDGLHTASFVHGTSMFLYVANFQEEISASKDPVALIASLHDLFSLFDSIIKHHHASKIKWMGSCYIAICGIEGNTDHAVSLLKAATHILDASKRFFQGKRFPKSICVKIGLETGTYQEALLGTARFRQDYFSDALNTSSRMASTADKNSIQITEELYEKVKNEFEIVCNGKKTIKGKGEMVTYNVV